MIDNETPATREAREQLQRIAAGCAQALATILPKDAGIGFAVVLFDFDGAGHIAYASNGQRADVVKSLRELLDKVLIEGEAQALAQTRTTDA